MIVYLKNHEIDRDLWDACINASPISKPYAYSWYLDIMAPGWEALIDDEYDSVFPIPARKRFGIKYIATPIFLQQLGTFSPDKSAEAATSEFLDYMPEFYWLIDLSISHKVTLKNYTTTERSNFELDLSPSYDIIWEHFENSCKHDVEKSSLKKPLLADKIKPFDLINLFIRMKENVSRNIKPRDFNRLGDLMEYCLKRGIGRIAGVKNKSGNLIFGQFNIHLPGYINMLFRVNTPESRELRLNYFYINEIIKEFAGTNTILDFAGSSVSSVATFIRSFGPIHKPYYRIYRNRLPWPVRLLK